MLRGGAPLDEKSIVAKSPKGVTTGKMPSNSENGKIFGVGYSTMS
jgi:hypothetical protein